MWPRLEARAEASRRMRWLSPLLAVRLDAAGRPGAVRGAGPEPVAGLAGVLPAARERSVRPERAAAESHAADADRHRTGGRLSRGCVEHRRGGAVHRRRAVRDRRRAARRRCAGALGGACHGAGRCARRGAVGGHPGMAAHPLGHQRDPGVADAGVRGADAGLLADLRPVEGPGRLQLPADPQLRRQRAAADPDRGHAPARGLPAGAGGAGWPATCSCS